MTDELDFSGKTILVTGSGRNIGKAIILEFAGRGANVIINARSNREEAEAVAKEAAALGAATLIVMGEAADLETVADMRKAAEDRFGRVDIYVSNAARRFSMSFFETTNADWHTYLNQQLTASWYLAKAFTPGMIEAGWGRIIHMNGVSGWTGGWGRIPHAVGKGGLRTLTKSLASGLGQFGITVNDINPGLIATQRDLSSHPEMTQQGTDARIMQAPIRRQPTPSEIAWACVFLSAQRSGAITGSVVTVDGGSSMVP